MRPRATSARRCDSRQAATTSGTVTGATAASAVAILVMLAGLGYSWPFSYRLAMT